jgi:hypothetical protein
VVKLKVTKEELLRRMLDLPEDAQQEALELLSQLYASKETTGEGAEVTLCAGTEYELIVPIELLPTLEEWKEGAEAELRDPSLGPEGGMPGWEARAPARVVEAYKLEMSERVHQVAETMAMFEDDEGN